MSRCNAAIAVNLQCSEGCSSDSNSSKTRLSGWVIISRRSCLNGWLYLAILTACSRLSSKYLFRKGVILLERRRGLMSDIVSNTSSGSLPFSGVGLLHFFRRLYHPLLLANSPPLYSMQDNKRGGGTSVNSWKDSKSSISISLYLLSI